MGHYCKICHCYRANERFSGKGHRAQLCKDCARLPRETRLRIEALNEIWGFLAQSNISEKNTRRLALLAESNDVEVRETAAIVLEVGKAHPRRRKRYSWIRRNQPDLWTRMVKKGLVEDWEAASDWGDSRDLADEADEIAWDQTDHGSEKSNRSDQRSENYDQTDLDDGIPF